MQKAVCGRQWLFRIFQPVGIFESIFKGVDHAGMFSTRRHNDLLKILPSFFEACTLQTQKFGRNPGTYRRLPPSFVFRNIVFRWLF